MRNKLLKGNHNLFRMYNPGDLVVNEDFDEKI